MKTANVSLKVPASLALEMRVAAAKRNMSRSAAIREAMRRWLDVQIDEKHTEASKDISGMV